MQLKTAGDLRGFLADVLVGIRDGTVDANQANAISKVASQINSSLACEIQARIHLKELGQDNAGEMVIASPPEPAKVMAGPAKTVEPDDAAVENKQTDLVDQPAHVTVRPKNIAATTARKQDGDRVWCEQCEVRVTTSQAVSCKSAFCKAKEAA